ncbi:hypothetical protein LTR86_002303 [Recurvomyces mirabilis]|nr:hypothetical protein LTR86_002303 [Recurvomyces mirabilis]
MEARPILYQRPLTLISQAQFFELVQRSDPVDLLHISLSSLLDGSARITAWALYQKELERLDRAFRTISGLRRLVLRPPAVSHSQLLRGMYLSFLSLIPQQHPSLQNLVIEDNKDLLNKVPSLRDLPNVHFTITTDSTPDRKQTCPRSPTVKVELEENKEDLLAEPTLPEDSGLVDKKAKTKKPALSPKQARCKRNRSTIEPAKMGERMTAADTVIKARVRKPATQVRPGIAGRRRRGDE